MKDAILERDAAFSAYLSLATAPILKRVSLGFAP
jgi:hypothetical protein